MIHKEDYIKLTKKELNSIFINSCENGNLELVKYLLTTSELKEHADINAQNDKGFIKACENGHLEIVKYLLTSPNLKEHANINAQEDSSFVLACSEGHLEIVKYLLTSPELKEHSNIHAQNDNGFISACEENFLNVVNFLIFDMNIEIEKSILENLKENINEYCWEIKQLLLLNELNTELNENDKIKTNRIKV